MFLVERFLRRLIAIDFHVVANWIHQVELDLESYFCLKVVGWTTALCRLEAAVELLGPQIRLVRRRDWVVGHFRPVIFVTHLSALYRKSCCYCSTVGCATTKSNFCFRPGQQR